MVLDAREEPSVLTHMPPLSRLVKVVLLLTLLSFASDRLNLGAVNLGGVTILWPSNAFLLGVLLCNRKRHWTVYLTAGYLVDLALNLSKGTPVSLSFYLSVCNMLEVVVAAALLYPIIAPRPDLTERRQLTAFVLYGVLLATAIAGFLASFTVSGHLAWPEFRDFFRWFTADALGMATITPLYLSFRQGKAFGGRSWAEIMGLFVALCAGTFAVFWQTRFPFLFAVLPLLLVVGIRLGLAGSALGLMLVSIIGGFLSTAGRGPLSLMKASSDTERDLFFQFFIAMSMLVLYVVEVIVSDGKRLQADLQGSERRFRLLAEASSDVIVLTGLDGKRHYVSPACLHILGWTPHELVGGSFRELIHPDDVPAMEQLFESYLQGEPDYSLEYRCRKANGEYLWLEINPRLYRDPDSGKPEGFVSVARDISRRKSEEQEQQRAYETIEQMASSDALTGIANRRQFDMVLEREWLRALRDQSKLSLLLIDVDRFKPYNDVYGHLTGDDCLRQMVAAIKPLVSRPADLFARYGGEEFVVVLPNTDSHGACQMAEWIRRVVQERRLPHPGNLPHAVITLSIGCATMTPRPEISHLQLLEAADRALYRAKSSGRNCVQLAEEFPEAGEELLTG